MDDPPDPLQPVFNIIADSFADISGEIARCDEILTAVRDMNHRLEAIEDRTAEIEARMKAMDANNLVRSMNNKITNPTSKSELLKAIATGEAIIGFSHTVGEIRGLNGIL
ncbi:hypothetical protein F4811DRAFT_554752 [Daldinia bambusicola]|nr:hypothetical protein F4811DRAFT_554752 [Daldinia bambusicola]